MIEFTVPGEPVGKARPRLGRRGRVYTPAATKAHEELVRSSWLLAGGRRIEGPLAIHVVAETARPASHWLKGGGLSAAGRRSVVPTKKPDLDNVLKLVADALNGHAYQDDAWIVAATVERRWAPAGTSPRTEVRLYPALMEVPS